MAHGSCLMAKGGPMCEGAGGPRPRPRASPSLHEAWVLDCEPLVIDGLSDEITSDRVHSQIMNPKLHHVGKSQIIYTKSSNTV